MLVTSIFSFTHNLFLLVQREDAPFEPQWNTKILLFGKELNSVSKDHEKQEISLKKTES